MKKMKDILKRKVSVGLVAVMLVSQTPATAFAEETVKQETAAEPVSTQEMTAASEAPQQTKNETAAEGEIAPEQQEDKTGDETPVEAAVPIEPSTLAEAADNGSEDEAEKQETPESDKKDGDSDNDKEKEEDKAAEEKKTPAFKESRSVDGVRITVEAEEGVFPEGAAALSVEKVTAAQERKAEEAVEDKRPEEQNVAASYTYDIKVLDKDGNEIQPADESKVKVSFQLEEVADGNLTTNVYHIVEGDPQNGGDSGEAAPKEGDNLKNSSNEEADAVNSAELTAEKLEVETDGDTAMVETDGFSLYTVEFTYDSMQYVLPGDSEVALSDILEAVGLSGEASAVEVSKSSLFSAEKNEGGEWIVTAHKAFSTKEWMKVIIGGVEYEITVTDDQEAGSWAELQAQFDSASMEENYPTLITLSGNVTAGEGDSALVIQTDKYVTLDLAGHTIDRGLTNENAKDAGNVITVNGNLTLTDSSTDHTGTITGGNNTGNGGGVYVGESGKFTMENSTISGCNANGYGGGVYVNSGLFNSGTFIMNGGSITNCSANSEGGGVYVYGYDENSRGEFTMTDGTISGCSATGGYNSNSYGGGVCVNGGTFTMENGTISGCEATNGGGVYFNDGTFTMKNSTINGCKAEKDSSYGGGVYVNSGGTFTMENSTISGCSASFSGGVYVIGGEFTMNDGTISGCSATHENSRGGGVYVDGGGKFTMNGGTITGCNAVWAGGVYVEGSTFQVSGAPVIRDNKKDGNDNNVVLDGSETITVTGALTDGAEIWVNVDKEVAFAKDDGNYNITDTDLAKFHSDKDSSLVAAEDSDGSVKFFTPWGALQAKFNNASTVSGNPTLITLSGNITAGEGDSALEIPTDRYVTLDLSGNTINRGLTNENAKDAGNVITVNGNLTLTDSSSDKTGKLTGGKNNGNGGGVCVFSGTFTMKGGTISGCEATNGGGVYVWSGGTFKVSGTPVIKGNKKGENANNVELNSGKTISVNGALTSGAEIYVNADKGDVVATGENYTLQASDADAFHSDRDGSLVAALDSDGTVKFFNPWGALQVKFNNASTSSQQPTRITLTGDVTADEGDSALLIPAGRYVTLDFAGHTIDRGLAGSTAVENGNVITVLGNLTISDNSAAQTGKITGGNNTGNGGGVIVSGTFTMNGGAITGCKVDDEHSGGGVYVNSGGTFNMESGTISGCSVTGYWPVGGGGGVYVFSGTFTMKGGTISGCSVTGDEFVGGGGGGVYVFSGTFTMKGGAITGCKVDGKGSGDGGGVYVCDGSTFTMEGGTITNCSAEKDGGVSVKGGTFTMEGGTITNCSARIIGGVSVERGGSVECGTFTMTGGTIESCREGGVYVGDSTFTMSGGTITNCSAENGGGVFVGSGTFTMEGGTISGCSATVDTKCGGGVYVNSRGTFTMENGTITGCTATNDGGGVYVDGYTSSRGTFTMTGGTITNCSAKKGGGVSVEGGKFTMNGGTISGCTANNSGGGVFVDDNTSSRGTFTMENGTITNCSAKEGGGVYVDVYNSSRGTFTMTGGTISGCTANNSGGGVYVNGTFTMMGGTISGCTATNHGGVFVNNNCTFQVSGAPVIRDNKKGSISYNVALKSSGTTITVTGALTDGAEIWVNADKGVAFATKGGSYSITDTDLAKFHSDKDSSLVAAEDSDGVKFFTPWGALQAKFNNASTVSGNPTLITLTGDVTADEGDTALVIPAGKYVTLDLSGNTLDRGLSNVGAVADGNVITVEGNLTLTDSSSAHTGTITGGNNTGKGGGVYNRGTFTMSGGTITGCSARANGGGVYIENGGTFKVSGTPVISGNKISGTNSPNNVELNGKTISVNGALTSGAEIHVNAGKGVVATGENYTLQASDADAFHSDRDGSLTVALDSDGKVKFFNPWGALQLKFNNASTVAGSPTQITLSGNVTADEGDSALVIPEDRYVTLDLNGHTIDRGLASQGVDNNGNVITVSGNLTLTDNSSAHTGTITGGNNEQAFGGGVSVNGGTFTMDGGTISGCNAARGGGVNVDSGTFTMTGGTITGCNAYDSGGGVCVNGSFTMNGGTFTMTGGTITDCNATSHGGRGGGVYVEGGCKFTMDGGTISGCKATNGGGVYNHDTFNMSDGTITNCSATGDESNGGGVYIEYGSTFKVSGTPVISGNMKGSTSANNVELGGKTISVNGALTSGAEIHVNAGLGVPIAEKGGDRTTALTETEAGYFKSDVSSDLLGGLNDAGQVVFKEPLPALTAPADLTYNGTEQTPELTFEGATLTAGTDYTVSYKKVVEGTETSIIGAPKDAGTYKAVAAGKGNYAGTSEAEFTINRKEVTVNSGISANDKTYDGTAAATLDTTGAVFDGICTDDSLTVSGNGAFADASAGSGKNVTISDLTLGGTSSGNYVLASTGRQTQTTATISKKKLTITGVTVTDKEYDGYTTATTDTTTASVNGLVGSETVTFTVSGAFADANKGANKIVTLSNWTLTSGGENYEIDAANSQQTAAASITGTQVYITGIHAVNKEYDGNKTATVSGTAVLKKVKDNSTVSDLSVSNITADFADKNVSDNKDVTITGGTLSDSENYTLIPGATTGLTANITPKPVTITGLFAKNKEYDTTAAATVTGTAVIDGKIGNDDVTVSSGTAAFDNANVSDNKTVTFTGYSLTGEDASNYELSGQPADVMANITKATPTIIAPAASAITYGQNLSNSTLTNGAAKLGETSIEGSFAWSDNTIAPAVSDSNKTEYTVTFTPNDTTNLNQTTCKVKLTVNKAAITADQLTAPTKVEDLKYTGQAQALISAGSVSGNIGTMQYALGTDASTSPTNGWGKVIPTGTNARTYYVWYKVVGDVNHNDYVSESPVSVTIEKAEYTGTKTVSVSVRSGQATSNKTVTLPALPEGASYASSGTVSGQTIDLISSNSISGTTLTFSTTAQNDQTSATITIRVTNATNYNDYDVVVTVTAKAKDEAGVVIAQGATLNKAYGDADLTLNATVSKAGEGTGTWTWTSTAPDVLSVTGSGSSATAHILKPGTATVNAEYESDTTMGEASIQINIAMGEKPANAPAVLNVKYEVTAISSCGLPDGWVWNTGDPNYSKTIPEGGSLAVTADYSAADRIYYNTTRVSVIICRADGGKKDDTETIKDDIGNKAAPKGIWIANLEPSYTYTGKNITPEVHVYAEDLLLTKGLDYTVSYKNNKNANDASVASKAPTVTVKLKGSYSGTKSATFRIAKLDLSKTDAQDIYKPVAKKAYGTIKPVLYLGGTELKLAGSEAAYENPTGDYYRKPGTYDITVKAKTTAKNVTGTKKVNLHIVDAPTMEKVKAKASKSSYKYGDIKGITDPKEAVPVKVTYNNAVITEGFTVDYESGTSWKTLGTHYITIKGDGKTYYGEKKISYKVTGKYSLDDDNAWIYIDGKKCDAGSDNISVSYNKAGIKPSVSIRYKPDFGSDQFVLTERQDFTVSYRNNRNAGDTAEVTIKGKGIYSGKLTRKFTVSKVDLNDLILFVSDRAESKTKDDFKKTTKILYDKNLVDQKAPLKDFDIKYTDKDGKEISGTPAKGTLVNVTVTAKDTCKNFTGTKSTGFHIIDKTKDVGKMKVSFTYDKNAKGKIVGYYFFTGAEIRPRAVSQLHVKSGQTELKASDYSVRYFNNVNKGNKAAVLITGNDTAGYFGVKTAYFKIGNAAPLVFDKSSGTFK